MGKMRHTKFGMPLSLKLYPSREPRNPTFQGLMGYVLEPISPVPECSPTSPFDVLMDTAESKRKMEVHPGNWRQEPEMSHRNWNPMISWMEIKTMILEVHHGKLEDLA